MNGVSDALGESLRRFPNLSDYNQLGRRPLEDLHQVTSIHITPGSVVSMQCLLYARAEAPEYHGQRLCPAKINAKNALFWWPRTKSKWGLININSVCNCQCTHYSFCEEAALLKMLNFIYLSFRPMFLEDLPCGRLPIEGSEVNSVRPSLPPPPRSIVHMEKHLHGS